MATWEYEQVEGWERILHTNNLGPSSLAICMVPKLLETVRKQIAVPRLVIVASDVHYWTTMEMDVIAPRASSRSCQTKTIAQKKL